MSQEQAQSGGCTETCPDSVNSDLKNALNKPQNPHRDEPFIIYPNPAENYIYINKNSPDNRYIIYDYTGALIYEGGDKLLDVSWFKPGIYLLQMDTGYIKKFIKE